MKNKNLIWLASYPKSGNTWFRAFLTALFSKDQSININALAYNASMANADYFEYATQLDISELKSAEIDNLKPEVMRSLSATGDEFIPVKIHDKYRQLDIHHSIIPLDRTKVVLYFIRNPLDIVVSYAHHDKLTYDRVIERMNENYSLAMANNREFPVVSENLDTWSNHVISWTNTAPCAVHAIRFEDMLLNGRETFKLAIMTLGLNIPDSVIYKAVENCKFDKLKEQEQRIPFKEKNPVADSFFRRGKVGSWRTLLSTDQVSQIINDHREVMRSFGYLDEGDNPLF